MILGIDLGTTNSLISYIHEGTPKLIPNAAGQFITPSVVSLDDNDVFLIGAAARERLYKYPERTSHSFKRLMGTSQVIKLGKESYDAEDLSALILRSLKTDAEVFLGHAVNDVVISVPAYFNEAQRKATKRAGDLAGLNVVRLINEPTAAALFHGIKDYAAEATFLIFDLGGGTFDVSILEKFEGVMEVRATGGDSFLGGDDFTQVLVELFATKAELDKSQKQSISISAAMRFSAEEAKRKLSENATVTMEVAIGKKIKSVTITQEDYERACKPLLERLRTPIESALRDARLRVGDLSELVMVGGATRMPVIRKLVTQLFGRLPARYIDPDQTIALGAAICAGLIDDDASFEEIVLTDVAPHSLGTEVRDYDQQGNYVGQVFLPIIERNTIVPASRVRTVFTADDNQREIKIKVYQGESRDCSKNVLLEEISFPIPPKPKGEISIDIRYTYDVNGMLEIDVDAEKAQFSRNIIINEFTNDLDDDEIAERRKLLAKLKIHPRDQEENRYLIERADRLFEQYLGDDRDQVRVMLNQFIAIVDKQDPTIIAHAREEFSRLLDAVERREAW